jgi:beta-glucosidase
MGAAMVAGFEGDDIEISCSILYETFVGYGGTTTGKTEPLVLYERLLRQFDLTIYQAAIKAGSKV